MSGGEGLRAALNRVADEAEASHAAEHTRPDWMWVYRTLRKILDAHPEPGAEATVTLTEAERDATDLRAAVLSELGVCPFMENVRDASMCVCGLPARDHDETAARVVLADHPAIAEALDLARRVAAPPSEADIAAVLALHEQCESFVGPAGVNFQCGYRYQFKDGDDFGHARRAHVAAAIAAAGKADQ